MFGNLNVHCSDKAQRGTFSDVFPLLIATWGDLMECHIFISIQH